MPGPMGKAPRGVKSNVKNPGKLLARTIGYVLKNYKIHISVVVICIFIGVLANVQEIGRAHV